MLKAGEVRVCLVRNAKQLHLSCCSKSTRARPKGRGSGGVRLDEPSLPDSMGAVPMGHVKYRPQ